MSPLPKERNAKIDKISKYKLAATKRYPRSYVAVDEDSGEVIEHSTNFSTVFSAAKIATAQGRHVSLTKDAKADTLCLV